MRRLVVAAVVFVAAVFLIVFLTKKTVSSNVGGARRTTTAQGANEGGGSDAESALGIDDSGLVSFMPLNPDETLLGQTGIDLDGDNADDEILVVQKGASPYLYLIVGLYNTATSSYDRIAEIQTEVTKISRFSYFGQDVTGDHRVALVYQGNTDDGHSVLQMYFCRRGGLVDIGRFKSDGAIFIQPFNRSENYELGQSTGRSFPVWVYSSDTRPGAGSLSQVQTEYDWDKDAGRYVQVSQVFVAGKNIASSELEKIQDGTVETFANYLNGLWYKVNNTNAEMHYIFFDYEKKEVVFIAGATQEVYIWQSSNLYRNGIYLSSVNISIENLRRRFDISLTGLDEMRVHVYDDVRMRIGADAIWNGNYMKMKSRNFATDDDAESIVAKVRGRLKEVKDAWFSSDGTMFSFREGDGQYALNGDSISESGIYFVSMIGQNCVIQFNSNSEARYLIDSYIVSMEEDSLVLRPARIMSSDVFEVSGRVITLSPPAPPTINPEISSR